MNVLHISENKVWGGNEQQLYSLITGLQEYAINQTLFCFEDSPLIKTLENIEVEIRAIEKCKVHSRTFARTLKEIVSSQRIDIIHLHTSGSLTGYVLADIFYNFRVKAIFSKKAVSSSTSYLSKFKYNYSKLNSIICVSEYVKNSFRSKLTNKNQHKLDVIYDGVSEVGSKIPNSLDIKDQFGLKKATYIIGNIANHTKAKSLMVLVETLHYLVNILNLKDIHLVQIGKFTSRTDALREKVKQYELEQYITFMGFTENADLYQSQFDVFLLTSEREGGPTVIIESFKNKTPVVTTNVGFVDDCVIHGETAMVSEVGDFINLAKNIFALNCGEILEEQLVTNAYDLFVRKFTEKKFILSTHELYKKILKN